MQYNRILVKTQWRILMGEQKYGIDTRCLESYARQIHESQRWESRSESSSEVEIFLED